MKMTIEIIHEPGKFEGELSIVPQMWDIALEGFGAEVYVGDTLYSFVTLPAIGLEPTGDLFGARLWERSDGFVCSEWYSTEAEYNAAILEWEKLSEEDSEDEASEYED
jgi:hypothetical protein